MTLKSLNKKFALASLALLTAGAIASAGAGIVQAADTQDQISDGTVIINAKGAAPATGGSSDNGQTNNATTQTPNTGNQTNQGTTTNDGTTQTVTGANMANVTFSATRVTPTGDASAMNAATAGSYTKTSDVTNQTTNADGVATFELTTDGYYLIHQVTLVGGVQEIKDFIVQVNSKDSKAGDLNVYPKLDLSSTDDTGKTQSSANAATDTAVVKGAKDTINNPNHITNPNLKTTDDATDTNMTTDAGNTNTAGSGDTVTYNVNTTFDLSQVTNNDSNQAVTAGVTNDTTNGKLVGAYSVTDVLPSGVKAPDASAVKVNDGKQSLTYGTDYTVTVTGQTVTTTLTTAGQEKVAADLAAGSNATLQLNVQIPTIVNDDAVGAQTDAPSTTVTNAYGVDLSNTAVAKTTVNVGGADIKKVAQGSNTALSGATFVLVQANSADAAKALVESDASYFNNDTAADSATTMTSADAAFVTDNAGKIIQTTTDANGVGTFTGLNLMDATDATATSDFSSAANYYAVEVVAPTGYQLPSAGTGSNVFNVTANVDPSSTTITNAKPFALPFTGGEGLAGILIIAGVAGLAAFAIKRRKSADEEATREQ